MSSVIAFIILSLFKGVHYIEICSGVLSVILCLCNVVQFVIIIVGTLTQKLTNPNLPFGVH